MYSSPKKKKWLENYKSFLLPSKGFHDVVFICRETSENKNSGYFSSGTQKKSTIKNF